jgi:hypothetical protein
VTQDIDTDESNPMARLLLHLMGAFAEFEREMIRERTLAGVLRNGPAARCLDGRNWCSAGMMLCGFVARARAGVQSRASWALPCQLCEMPTGVRISCQGGRRTRWRIRGRVDFSHSHLNTR